MHATFSVFTWGKNRVQFYCTMSTATATTTSKEGIFYFLAWTWGETEHVWAGLVMDYFVTMPQKLLLLSYVMSWPVVLAYPELHSTA